MAGKRRRAPNSLAGHRSEAPTRLLAAVDQAPPCPVSAAGRPLLETTQHAWERFWTSAVAGNVDRSDMDRVERWIRHVDEHAVLMARWLRRRTTKGSMGQPRLNPLWRAIVDLEHMIAGDEEQLAKTPLARVRQGLAAAAAGDAAARLEARQREREKPSAPKDVTPGADVVEGDWTTL